MHVFLVQIGMDSLRLDASLHPAPDVNLKINLRSGGHTARLRLPPAAVNQPPIGGQKRKLLIYSHEMHTLKGCMILKLLNVINERNFKNL